MSARTDRSFRPAAAAAAVVAAVAGTVLMPMSAQAATAGDAQRPLLMEMGTPAPNGPLTRGGATETFELTVRNPTDKAQPFHPWLLGDAAGASPVQKEDIVFNVDAVDAPATKSFVGHQDGGWQGLFYPASGKGVGDGFQVPANGKLTWKVTIGLAANYPTNDGDFTLTAASLNGEVAQSHQASRVFKADPQIRTGHLTTWFERKPGATTDAPNTRQYLDLKYRATGDGVFNTELNTVLTLSYTGARVNHPDFRVQGLIDGRWQDLKTDGANITVPAIEKGFGAAKGVRTLPLRINLGLRTQLKRVTPVTAEARVSLASGNTYPFDFAQARFSLGPVEQPTAPTGKPSAKPSGTPATKPADSASSSTPAVTANNAALTTTSTTGSLAHTGADSHTGLYAGVAAALVAFGGALAWLGARRRRGSSM
ncbi:hypothetical protein [Streptomyces sp. NPDC052811]|uniref:hypothetical protein n=1 Tax=Streptomyces sp. NPDC052811 TaxID=3155731 RepID=UPI003449090E